MNVIITSFPLNKPGQNITSKHYIAEEQKSHGILRLMGTVTVTCDTAVCLVQV